MSRILGIDVGTNSLGLTVRDDSCSDLKKQIVYSSVSLFKSGVDKDELSFAAQRTTFRGHRKLYRVRRYRKWATLELLIKEGYCPLTMTELNKWRHYDKDSQEKRHYPIEVDAFQQWIKLDFNMDGIPDYSTPYALRNELATVQLDFNEPLNRYKLGRAMYHIAERRGFKSNKGDTVATVADDDDSEPQDLKESEIKASEKLKNVLDENNLPTVGCALNYLIDNGYRVRGSEYRAIRIDYRNEIEYIFNFQDGLDTASSLFKGLISTKKNEGTIFYNNPLKSQKGNVGKCVLEPSKPRCPESRPEFEYFRAYSFINNIRFGQGCEETLSEDLCQELYESKFIRATDSGFKFETIRKWIESKTGCQYSYSQDVSKRTINYKDTTPLAACCVTYRLKNLLGDDWNSWSKTTDYTHTASKEGKASHAVTYTWEDVWHMAFTADDEDEVAHIADKIGLPLKELKSLWKTMSIGYANLSLKAINNINHFLSKGMIYSKACMLAKLPDIFGKEHWTEEIENTLIESVSGIISHNLEEKKVIAVVNNLISQYKATEIDNRQGHKDFDYKLNSFDYKDIDEALPKSYGQNTWSSMPVEQQQQIRDNVADYYQQFFADEHRDYIHPKTQEDSIKEFITDNFDFVSEKSLKKIYHHSKIDFYAPAKDQLVDDKWFKLLGSPAIASIRNPMALRVLHTLRRKVNELIIAGIINDEDTRIVVEVARSLNDANMRWAIEKYDSIRNAENETIKEVLSEYGLSEDSIRRGRMHVEQVMLKNKDTEIDEYNYLCARKGHTEKDIINELCKKYKLWLEQDCISIYTGNPIKITDLLNGDKIDVEHTLPRSRSFDDSLSNQTVCESYYNRSVKKNKMPSELDADDYNKILRIIKPWEDKVEHLRDNIRYWRSKSRKAQTKDQKDYCIRQRHLWELECNYWEKKVATFHTKEITTGFRNSQLVDTSIIAKYTILFLKSVFSRVEVQRGSTTAAFRKILGIQAENQVKDRSNHTHHAIDAYTLTLIPIPAVRERILNLYYQIEDSRSIKDTIKEKESVELLNSELIQDHLLRGHYDSTIDYLRDNVIAIHEQRNQQFATASKRERVRGRIVPQRDDDGNIIFEKNDDGSYRMDAKGHKIPLAKRWAKGDCIRGELHEQTYYGRIKIDGEDKYVHRRSLDSFKSWDDLEKNIINTELFKMMKNQFPEGTSLPKAIGQGIYMIKKEEQPDGTVKEIKINKIRHVRSKAPSNASPTPIRKHTYLSRKDYKQNVYPSKGDLPLLVQYDDGKKIKYESFNLLQIAQNKRDGNFGVPDRPGCLKKLIWKGTMILLYKDNKSELYSATPTELAKRLYVIEGFEAPARINCIRHNIQNVGKDKGESSAKFTDYSSLPNKIRTGASSIKFLIAGYDFKFENGKIVLN